ncbi:retrovirus-related pol polyprotein from transposon TNT 1-94 [Tanacetum coccineum]|uniref:Retrovirus-related pol polyprotein from transposon TNT 1-94 n=1 Tax=Tanacetum coccineum TaxID=301880 RepID=A0ABQ5D0F4_9ASTR
MEILINTCLMPLALKTHNDSFVFVHELKQEMHADLKYVESLEKEIDEPESDKAEFSNMYDMLLQECVSNDVMCSYLHSLSDLDAHTELQCLYLHKVKEYECLAQKLSKQTEFVSKEVYTKLLRSFAELKKHSISLELALQQCQEQLKNDTVYKEKASNVFLKECEQYFEIQDLKAQLQDKDIAICELKKLIEKYKGKSVETKFDKPSVVRQPNAQRIPKLSVLGKPAPFSDYLERKHFSKTKSVPKTNASEGLSKPVTTQNLPQIATQAVSNTNVIKPGMYRIDTQTTQTRVPQLPQTSRNTNPRMSASIGVNHRTNVSRPQLKSNKIKEKVMPNTSQVKFKKTEVEDHLRISRSNLSCIPSSSNSLADFTTHPIHCTVRFGNDQFALILGYGDLVQGNITINRVYYVEGLNHNLFSVGQFYDADLEVAFRKSTLSHLNFDHINLLSKKNVVIGLPKLKYVKDQLCSSCEVSKAKRSSFKTKTVPSLKGRLNLLHMDLCGPMRVASINGKKYILKSTSPVISVRTGRGTEFLNKTLNAFFKEEGIEHQTSTPRTPEQNGVVERRNRTLVEAARTMLSASKLPLFFWAEAIATACYTQNRSIIIPTHEKTAYHIINDRKPSIKHLHIFGCTCYLTRDGENLDKMKEKGDPCILVGYSTQSKGYPVYNKRTCLIVGSIHLRFDEIKEMTETSVANDTSGLVLQRQKSSDYDNSDPVPQLQNISPLADTTVPSQQELDLLFDPLYDEFFNPGRGFINFNTTSLGIIDYLWQDCDQAKVVMKEQKMKITLSFAKGRLVTRDMLRTVGLSVSKDSGFEQRFFSCRRYDCSGYAAKALMEEYSS